MLKGIKAQMLDWIPKGTPTNKVSMQMPRGSRPKATTTTN